MALDFLPLPGPLAARLGLPPGKSVPVTPESRARLEKGGPSVEAIVEGCEAYLEIDPDDPDYRGFLKRFYHHRGATLANAGRVREAFGDLVRAGELGPGDVQLLRDLMHAALEIERPDDAIEAARGAIAAGGRSPEIYDGLARAFSMKQDHKSARAVAEQARKDYPDDLMPLHTQATVLYHAGDKAAVERVLFEALQRDPSSLMTLEKLTVWLRECMRYDEARHVLRRALELAPDAPRLLYQRGMIEFRSGDLEAAEKTFRRILESGPDDLDARTALGLLLTESSRPTEAEALFAESAGKAPRDYRAHFHLGRLCARDSGRLEEALGHFGRMLDLAPRDRAAVHTAYIVARNAGGDAVASRAEAIMRSLGEEPRIGEDL